MTGKTLLISSTLGIEGRKLLRPDDDYDPLREFNASYEGARTAVEEMHLEYREAPRIGGRPGPCGAGPWPERPVSEANRSGNDHPAPRLAADQSALALSSRCRVPTSFLCSGL
ncbi:MAG: hypothetical protein F4232_11105 [Acidimicrobiaceae bacterium]|nr:hypothetical protein [Acidimicrobiaceae bacterium]